MFDGNEIEAKTKCPKCQKSDLTEKYFYGIFRGLDDLTDAQKSGGRYGGDIIDPDNSPDFHCQRCSYDWQEHNEWEN